MKKLLIDGTTRKINKDKIVVGYLQENKIERLEFEIPDIYKDFGKKACFNSQGKTFAKTFDNITSNTLTLTRDMTQYNELEMSIAFFKTENEDEIVARTSILKIYIENAIICDDDIQPDDPKIVILDNLITKVTELNEQVTKNEKIRQNQEITRQQSEAVREENEQVRVFNELGRKKAEEERKTNENERVSNENSRKEYINNLKTQVENGEFDGADFNYKWDGTKLGVKNSKETTYQFVELKGDKGDKGDTGNGIQNIEKISTVENVDTYAINYTNGTQTTFDVTNGEVTKEQLDEVDNRVKKTRNELERVKNDILETGTASDSFINVQDSAMAEMQELSIDGVCEQETTTGKNKLPNNAISQTINGIAYTVNPDKSVYAKGTATVRSEFTIYDKPFTLKANTEYKFQTDILMILQTSTGYISGAKGQTFTSESEISVLKAYIRVENGTTMDKTIYPMITLSNQNDTYEPYTGGQSSPSPDYPQEIKTIIDSLNVTSHNKNIFNKNDFKVLKSYYIGVYGNVGQAVTNSIIYMPIKRNTSYSIQKISSNRFRVGTYNNLEVLGKTLNNVIKNLNDSITSYTLNNDNDKYLFFQYLGGDTNEQEILDSIQIEEGLISTKYADHQESSLTFDIPEGEFVGYIDNNYKDELDVVYNEIDGQWHKVLKKRLQCLSLAINDMNNSDDFPGWQGTIINKIEDDFPFKKDVLRNLTGYLSNISREYYSYGINTNSPGIPQLWINSTVAFGNKMTQSEIKSKYTDLIVKLYYGIPQNNQYEVDLGTVDMPLSYNEVTNIFTDSDLLPTINAKYYRNFTKTIQNLQVNEMTLKQELININNRLTALETAKTGESEEISDDTQE